MVPEWVQDSIFYQIFPDRFANGDPKNDPPQVQAWGSPPTQWGFQGGDLQGVIQRIPYLLELGVTALYLNPIFQATSNHRYNTTDYYRIDPKLGTDRDFDQLLDVAHQNDLRVVLDGVFNHCGRGFFAFNDVLENQEHSPYRDWFHITRFPVQAYGREKTESYEAWWKVKSLPKFNTQNAQVRRYLFGVARHWIERGADGWRLDVPNEIDDDSFWAEFRAQVKAVNSSAYLLGEIWEVNPRWVGPHHFDGLMNYPFRDAVLDYVTRATLSASAFAERVEQLLRAYPEENAYAHYVPLGTHDTERLRTLCGEDDRRVRQMILMQFSYPGAPAIYYGDEIGLTGGKDPDCRKAFPQGGSLWDHELRTFVRGLSHLRSRLPVLRRGSFQRVLSDDTRGLCAFLRRWGDQVAVVVLNASDKAQEADLDLSAFGLGDRCELHEHVHSRNHSLESGVLTLAIEPRGGVLFHSV